MQSALAFAKERKKLVTSFMNIDPQSSGSNLLARCHNHLYRNEMQDLNKKEQRRTRTLLP
jgi:hypothetical protein